MLAFVGLHWPSLAFLAFVALDDFLKQKLAFVDKIQAQMTCFQQSDVKTNYQTRSGILKHCVMALRKFQYVVCEFLFLCDNFKMRFNNLIDCETQGIKN